MQKKLNQKSSFYVIQAKSADTEQYVHWPNIG